jgi:hypothetical protein
MTKFLPVHLGRGFMHKVTAPVASLILSAVFTVSLLHAEPASCSAAGANCRTQVKIKAPASAQADLMGKCAAAVQQCKANCNGKTSVYVSNFDGSQHPTGSCK